MSRLLLLSLAVVASLAQKPGTTGTHSFQFPDGPYPRPFELKLDQSFLDMTVGKVRGYRPTTGVSTEWDMEGPLRQNITDVASYWGAKYSWRSVEKEINRKFHHYATTVPGSGNYTQPIHLHFIYHRSRQHDAIPLLLLHGWPSSFLEWSKVVEPLSQHPTQSFHIVAPDLPGFGFSPAPEQAGFGPREMGKAFDALMHELGYDRYGIVTTDLGWFAGMWMVHDVEDNIIGHMSDFFIAQPTTEDRARLAAGSATAEEAEYVASVDEWFGSHWAYATAHGQKPLALSLALADSPVGLLGWLWDVNYATSDGYPYSHEELITDTMMLWIPGPYSNMRTYLEVFKPYVMNFPASKVPTGVSEWGWGNGPFSKISNFAFAPRDWVERTANLVYFQRHESGGHFPAISQPHQWVEDVREFFFGLDKADSTGKDEL